MGSAWNGDRNSRVWRQLFRRPLALSRDTLTAMINIKLSLLRRNPETLACHHTLQHVDESLRQLRHRLGAQPPQRGFEHRRVEHRAHHELARGPTAGRELVDQRDARARLHQRAGVLRRASLDRGAHGLAAGLEQRAHHRAEGRGAGVRDQRGRPRGGARGWWWGKMKTRRPLPSSSISRFGWFTGRMVMARSAWRSSSRSVSGVWPRYWNVSFTCGLLWRYSAIAIGTTAWPTLGLAIRFRMPSWCSLSSRASSFTRLTPA